MDHPDPTTAPKASARRRLIRGAFAAPALMTVCSGSAFAVTSNMRCLANAANAVTAPAAWSTPGPDSFLRARLYRVRVCIKFERDTNQTVCKNPSDPKNYTDTFYIKGSDLSSYVRGAGMPSNAQYLQINPASYNPVGSPVTPVAAPPLIILEGYVNQYVAVRFNASGVLIGVGPGTPGGMVGISCWASAFPTP